MGDEHGISWPDGGMVASDSGMSYHSCNKPDYHYRVKQLEKGYDELRTICNRQKERNAELEACKEECTQRVIKQAQNIRHYEEVAQGRIERIAELEAELEEQKAWSARLLQTREQFSKELGQCHDARKNDYERIAELEAEVAALESELAIAKAGIEAMTGRIK